ncbi:MAG TPA: phage holin family protein [Beijerinckiaceae bacterium]|jgi:hypothetical protein
MADRDNTIHNLLGEALRDSSELARKEFALFRTELTDNVRTMVMGLALLIVAAVFAIASIMLFTQALVEWLATVVGSEALAALIVGGALLLLAIGLGLWGRSAISSFSLTPQRTVRSIKRDGEVLSERVTG